MRRVVVQCRFDDDIPKLMDIVKEFDAILIKPEKPERFDNIHFDVPEDTSDHVENFKPKVDGNNPSDSSEDI
ncbi:hypothetical protein AHF37_05290 [Paragonimus kellicotti]|nr:hypothetical protein AHF37_05290 [Paragonimus kellicotti]